MKSPLVYIAGYGSVQKKQVYDLINNNNNPYITHLNTTAPKVRATIEDISNLLCKHTIPISYGVKNFVTSIYVCYDYLLPALMAYYFQYSRGRGLISVYGLLEKLRDCNDFVVPSYVHYIPFKFAEGELGINQFFKVWNIQAQSQKLFRQIIERASWECFCAMQEVFAKETYFDIYNPNDTKIKFPIKAISNNIYQHTTIDLALQKRT